jgi:hypothetical protein
MTALNHVELGLDDLPKQQRKPLMDAVATSLLRRLNDIEAAIAEVFDALNLYGNAPTKTFLLDALGELLGQERLTGQSDDSYRRTLRVRVLVRLSCGTLPDIARVAQAIAREFGDGRWDTYSLGPHRIIVTIGGLDPDPLVQQAVIRLLLDSVGDVDWLRILVLPQQPFTFSVPALGWSVGLWAQPIFDTTE